MDRSPYGSDPRGSAARPSMSREEHESRRGLERLPPILPSSQTIPKLPLARPESLASSSHRLASIQDLDAPLHSAHRPYLPLSDRPSPYDATRRPSPPSTMPVGLVSADYAQSRRSPGDTRIASHPNHPAPSYSYSSQLVYRSDPYRQDVPRAHASSHVPYHHHYDAPPPHIRPAPQAESVTTSTPIKRPRVSLACLACRNRKSRCDGVRPTCKTCATMKIACKWPEVDFRRAKTGEAARTQKRTPPGSSSQHSPESLPHHSRGDVDPAGQVYTQRAASGMLPTSQPVSIKSYASGTGHTIESKASSPTIGGDTRYRTHSDGDRDARHALHSQRSPSERHLPLPRFPDRGSATRSYADIYAHPRSSIDVPLAATPWMRDDRPQSNSQDCRATSEEQVVRPLRPLPESHYSRSDSVAIRCRSRAAEIATLARPATDAQRISVEVHMSQDASLEDLIADDLPGERLDRAFAADWEAMGGLSTAAQRPFMDVAAGLVGVLEVFRGDAHQDIARPSANDSGRLHIFRLRNTSATAPELLQLSIAMDMSCRQEHELLEATTRDGYDQLSYPVPVDRLSLPLIEAIQRALEDQAQAAEKSRRESLSTSASQPRAASPPSSDGIPFVRKQDIKPPLPVLELFFDSYLQAIGEQMPGLDTKVVASRIRDGSISALLANALCAIGASLHERVGQQPSIDGTLSSKHYLERARALIGAALQNPDLEAILALGVMAIRDILMGQMVSSAVIVSSAVRLCMQLDLHRAQPPKRSPSPPSTAAGEKLAGDLDASDVFWMVYCLDRITSIATARPLAIKDGDIDTVFPATMRDGKPCIFAALVRQLHYLGRLAEVSTSSRVGATIAKGDASERARARETEREVAAVGADLIGHYESLPSALQLGPVNLRRAHEAGEAMSFLQLHLTHHMALLHRFLLPSAVMTNAEYNAMRSAAAEIVEICKLAEALDPTLLADTPLSAVACFLSGCVWLSEIETLEESMQAVSNTDASSRGAMAQLEAAQSTLAKIISTLGRHAEFWPVARNLVDVLQAQRARSGKTAVLPATVASIVSQVEAIHLVVRRPGYASERQVSRSARVQVRKVYDLEDLRSAFPHLC
ncbi:C6 transcription factor [Pseudozyma hubeiensis]|nr:C6 transcription factor [Pseudozyma hubeiensis]